MNAALKVRIAELLGDGIGPELARALHRVADALPLDFEFVPIDWSLETREARGDAVIDEAERAIRETCLALKYPTETRGRSPNALIRRRLGLNVIYRPAVSLAGIASNFGKPVNLHIVRVATGGTYEDPGMHIGEDSAVSLRMVERGPCTAAATFAFELARSHGYSVTSSSKHTIQKATDGLFETVVEEVHDQYPDVPHRVELFDALLGKVLLVPEDYQVVLVLNEYGDFLSDMAGGLIGSLGVAASGNYALDADCEIELALFDPAGGTAPDLAGRGVCNPTAMLLAFAMLLDHVEHQDLGQALRQSLLGAIEAGEATQDLGGTLSTSEFTDGVIERVAKKVARTPR